MKTVRIGVGIVGAILLSTGYFVSQASFFANSTSNYVQALDQSTIPLLSLALLVSAVVLAMLPRKNGEAE